MPIHAASAAVLLVLAASPLGTPLRQDGFTVRPPEGFRMMRMGPLHGTWVGAIPGEDGDLGFLSAALVDGDGADAASMLVSVLEGSFEAGPSTRDDFSSATVRHFNETLGMPLSLEHVELVREGARRIEVRGTVRQQDQLRRVLVAGMEGEGRHVVITFSVPSGRYEALLPALRASLDTFRADSPPSSDLSRSVAGAAATVLASALFGSWSLWRRRRRG
ncbi:MAG: hypothetical protein WBV82_12050 [Myxococcaceae bacterium]